MLKPEGGSGAVTCVRLHSVLSRYLDFKAPCA